MEEEQISTQNNSNQFSDQQNANYGIVKNKKSLVSELKLLILYLLTIPIGFLLSAVLFIAFMKLNSANGAYLIGIPLFLISLPIFIFSGILIISKRIKVKTNKNKVLIFVTVLITILILVTLFSEVLDLW